MAANALVVHQSTAITVHRDADLYRLGALLLRRLDRCGVNTRLTRIVVYGQRIVAYHLPLLYRDVHGYGLAEYLKARTGRSVRLIPTSKGCTLLIDLASAPKTDPTIDPEPNRQGEST
jgi:hypothetical protein